MLVVKFTRFSAVACFRLTDLVARMGAEEGKEGCGRRCEGFFTDREQRKVRLCLAFLGSS